MASAPAANANWAAPVSAALSAILASTSLAVLGPLPSVSSALLAALCWRSVPWSDPIRLLAAFTTWALVMQLLPETPSYFAIDAYLAQTTAAFHPAQWQITDWLLGGLTCAAATLLAGYIPPRALRPLALGLLTAALLWNAFFLQPALTAKASVEPIKFSYDGHLYLKAWYFEKTGLDHYQALSAACRADARQIPLLNVRSPLLYWLWQVIPANPTALVVAYSLAGLVSCAAIYGLAKALGADDLAWLAPVLYAPQLIAYLLTSCTLYSEIWGAWLALGGCYFLGSQRPRAGLTLLLAAAMAREHFLVFYLLASTELLLRRSDQRYFVAALSPIFPIFYWWHRIQSAKVWASFNFQSGEGDSRLRDSIMTGFDPPAMLACLKFGWNLHLAGEALALVVTLSGFYGLWSARQRPGAPSIFSAMAALLLAFCFVSHHQKYDENHYAPDYFGAVVLPFLIVGVPVALNRLRAAHTPAVGNATNTRQP